MPKPNHQNPSWPDYLGDTLRGNVPVNPLIPQHPYLLDTLDLAEAFQKNTQHIMLLTLEEAQGVVDDLCNSKPVQNATTYAGNIRDSVIAAKNIAKQISYENVKKLFYRLKGLGIKVIQYNYGGIIYAKIIGYASLRRILQGTRYKITSPKMLELGIGKAGINADIISGAKFCIWFSLAWRTIELIFKSDHDLAAFIGNITMDIAKVIVTIFVTKISTVFLVTGAALLGVTITISAGVILMIGIGFGITIALNYLDNDKYNPSEKLISAIKDGMKAQQDINQWNLEHTDPFTLGLMNTNG